MFVNLPVGGEEVLCFRDGDIESEPISSWCHLFSRNPTIAEPRVHSVHSFGFGSNKLLNLQEVTFSTSYNQIYRQWEETECIAHLVLRKMLAIVRTRRSANVVQGFLKAQKVALGKRNLEVQHSIGGGWSLFRESGRSARTFLMLYKLAVRWTSGSTEKEERGEKKSSSNHDEEKFRSVEHLRLKGSQSVLFMQSDTM
jgi:hypothetical protein